MKKEDCVIYKGKFFQIEWYYDANGNSQPYDYYESCDLNQKRKFLMLCQRMGDFGKINDITKFRNEGDGIFAFKPQPDRYLAFFKKGSKIIVTNAFRKSGDKMPNNEKSLAVKKREDYLNRNPDIEEETK
ncbi:MAG: type II toxin-antitoxin system RelE/ParE family toxin [Treponema sp.]|uniref:type II toxin-antitoxin system RelE/ParE family toxin n=1 Tax=Treponema sp. TaxID=166 RepID=UPI00298D9D95|nr:type II toxin-antitoxin system RelE/ParE family toxin [Treponema sp.]MCR5386991.1 type II toxin-antitoxin system RelE/ParE family toxin [Treponema sp.]